MIPKPSLIWSLNKHLEIQRKPQENRLVCVFVCIMVISDGKKRLLVKRSHRNTSCRTQADLTCYWIFQDSLRMLFTACCVADHGSRLADMGGWRHSSGVPTGSCFISASLTLRCYHACFSLLPIHLISSDCCRFDNSLFWSPSKWLTCSSLEDILFHRIVPRSCIRGPFTPKPLWRKKTKSWAFIVPKNYSSTVI